MHIHRATFDPNRGTNISPFLLGVICNPRPANRGAPMIIMSIGAKLRHPARVYILSLFHGRLIGRRV